MLLESNKEFCFHTSLNFVLNQSFLLISTYRRTVCKMVSLIRSFLKRTRSLCRNIKKSKSSPVYPFFLICFVYTSYCFVSLLLSFNSEVKDRRYKYSSIPIYNQINEFQVLSPVTRYSSLHLKNMNGSTPTDNEITKLLIILQTSNVILLEPDLLYSLGPSRDYFKTFKDYVKDRTFISFGIYKEAFEMLNRVSYAKSVRY